MGSLVRKSKLWVIVLVSLHLAACGGGSSAGGSSVGGGTAPTTTYVLTVNSAAPSSGVGITVSPADNNTAANGSTSFARVYNSGTSVTLTAPATAGTNLFSSWSGCNTQSAATCTVTMTANTTITVNYAPPALTTPTVTATPASSSITSGQSLQVSVSVRGSGATPTGSVTLTSGSYASAAVSLSNSAASITVPAGVLATGSDTLKVAYTPDTASSTLYNSASGTAPVTVTTPTFVLTVNSTNPSSGVLVAVAPSDNNGAAAGTTGFTRTYNPGTIVILTAPATASGDSFLSWSGCASSVATTCNITMSNNVTVTANYSQPGVVTSVSVSPSAVIIGTQQQFTATVTGTGNFSNAVSWALSCPSCGSLNPGTLSSTGLYITPYPAPANVTITATSTADTTTSGTVTVSLAPPATTTGPALRVDAESQTHPISPLIYGVNAFQLNQQSATIIHPSIIRWGGDDTSRYNYQNT